MKLRWITGAGVVALVAVWGCSAPSEDDPFADEKVAASVEALDLGSSSSELGDVTSADPAAAAVEVAASKKKGCRTRSVDPASPNVVHVVLDGCGGRFDRHVVNGRLTVTFTANADGSLHAETVSSDLTIDGQPFTRSVSADIEVAGEIRTVTRHSEKTGTKKNGQSLVQSGDEVVVIDRSTRCRTENGTGQSVVGGTRKIQTTISNLQTCEAPSGDDYCPTGAIEHVNEAKGKTVFQTFDGSATAAIETVKRKSDETASWHLSCTPRP